MTLEELWELFPIVLVPHNPEWSAMAKDEIAGLYNLLADYSPVITHIGSTAIPGIFAKPIIDILVEVDMAKRTHIRHIMETAGYICMSDTTSRMSFNKGYTPNGYADKVFHIHFHPVGDNSEIIFRDYLRTHPSLAAEYEALKQSLLKIHGRNRDAYTAAKTDFVNRILTLA